MKRLRVNSRRQPRRTYGSAVAGLMGGIAGIGLTIGIMPVESAASTQLGKGAFEHLRPAPVLCSGPAAGVAVDLFPTALVPEGLAGERVDLAIQVDNPKDHPLLFTYSFSVESDLNRLLIPETISPRTFHVGAAMTSSHQIQESVPAGLETGYYKATLKLAWRSTEGVVGVTQDDMYLVVDSGQVELISGDEWFDESSINRGIPLSEREATGP